MNMNLKLGSIQKYKSGGCVSREVMVIGTNQKAKSCFRVGFWWALMRRFRVGCEVRSSFLGRDVEMLEGAGE